MRKILVRITSFFLGGLLAVGCFLAHTPRSAAAEAPAAPKLASDNRTELTIDDTQYPVIILPGINHSVAYLADEEGNVVKDKSGNDLENGLLIVDTSDLVKNIFGKLLGPLLMSLLLRTDVKLSDGIKATLEDLFHVQRSDNDGNPVNNLIVKKYDYPVSEMDADTKDWFYRMIPVNAYADLVGEDMLYLYTFPLLGDPMESARGLVDYIEMVKQQKGVDKVNLLSVSLGGTILTAYAFNAANNDCLNDIAFLYHTARSCRFNGSNDYITDIGIFTVGTAHNANAHNLFRAGVITNIQHSLLLNHLFTSFSDLLGT